MAVRNLVFLRISYQSRRLLGLQFFGHGVLGVENPVIFQCFRGLRAKNLRFAQVSRGGGVPPDAQDLHPQHHQDYLAAMNLSLLFAHASGVLFCCFKRCWNRPVRALHYRAFGSLFLGCLRGVASTGF